MAKAKRDVLTIFALGSLLWFFGWKERLDSKLYRGVIL